MTDAQQQWKTALENARAGPDAAYRATARGKATNFNAVATRDADLQAAFERLGVDAATARAAVKRGSGAVDWLLAQPAVCLPAGPPAPHASAAPLVSNSTMAEEATAAFSCTLH